MNDEPFQSKLPRPPLDARFASRPHPAARLHALADLMDAARARSHGGRGRGDRPGPTPGARHRSAHGLGPHPPRPKSGGGARAISRRQPGRQKKLKWFTTFGLIEIEEQILRLARRGPRRRPFCQSAGVAPRSCSRRLQRVVTDFGAESSFVRTAARVREHYGIEVPPSAARAHTLRHARACAGTVPPAAPPAAQLLTQMDGSMVPIVEPGKGADARHGKQLCWREVRRCCAVWPRGWNPRDRPKPRCGRPGAT